jgi:hypothetical protein
MPPEAEVHAIRAMLETDFTLTLQSEYSTEKQPCQPPLFDGA